MKEQLEQRLEELKKEYESGRKMMAELEEKRANLQNTMLRISGAMQVLEEQLKKAQGQTASGAEQTIEVNNHAKEPVESN